jgi:hypothetical protein
MKACIGNLTPSDVYFEQGQTILIEPLSGMPPAQGALAARTFDERGLASDLAATFH